MTIAEWLTKTTLTGRFFLTLTITLLYNVTLVYALINGLLSINDYIVAAGPMNAAVLGWWFGQETSK